MHRYLVLGLIVVTPSVAQQSGNEPNGASTELFPAELAWESIEGAARETDTRFGVLRIERGEQCPGTREPAPQTEIRLDGELIQALPCLDGDYYIVTLKNSYQLGAIDVVILGASAGGSGSPPQRLHLIVLDPAEDPRIEMNPTFRSRDGTERVASDGGRLWFDLGYDTSQRKTATFDQRGLRIDHVAVDSTPVSTAVCNVVYEGALPDCIARLSGTDLSAYSFSRLLETPGIVSTASRNQLNALSHHPGFSGEEFMAVCLLAAQSDEAPAYDEFRSTVCVP